MEASRTSEAEGSAPKRDETKPSEREEMSELSPAMRGLILSFSRVDRDQAFDRAALARRSLWTS